MRELFIYYRIPMNQLEPALRDTLAFQARLRAAVPELTTRLLRRDDKAEGFETWMETYTVPAAHRPAGIDVELQAWIETEAQVLKPWINGPRHAEAFACAS